MTSRSSGHSDKWLDWSMMANETCVALEPLSRRGSDKESTLSTEQDGNKTLFPSNTSMNYELLSLGHGSLFTFSFLSKLKNRTEGKGENTSRHGHAGVAYL